MSIRSVSQLSDGELAVALPALAAQERGITTKLLVHIAEFDDRRLYLPAGYSSMFAYCVGALRLSEDAAYKRIQAARAGRKIPAVFDALEDGRLHLTAIRLLAPHLTPENAAELMTAATHLPSRDVNELVQQRFPEARTSAKGFSILRPMVTTQLVARQVEASAVTSSLIPTTSPAALDPAAQLTDLPPTRASGQPAPSDQGPEPCPESGASVEAQLAERQVVAVPPSHATDFLLKLTIDRTTHDKLRHLQALLSHSIPSGDLARVLDRALELAIVRLEKQKFAATSKPRETKPRERKPRKTKPGSSGDRHIPAHVRRAVRERDQERCAFVGPNGRRCEATRFLEFDHVDPVARGGAATVDRVRLLCRAHNQHEAERVFGAGFMQERRDRARARSA